MAARSLRFPAGVECSGILREVTASHQCIDGHRQLPARRRLQQCGVVADPQHHVFAQGAPTAEITRDDFELGQRHVSARAGG
ncbi:MAG: hypothetical protein ACWGNB_00320 [Thiogranum sp.]